MGRISLMSRDVLLTNGRLHVQLDADYQLRDVSYPHIGHEKQTGEAPCRFGVWCDGQFSWIGREWEQAVDAADGAMDSRMVLRHGGLGLELECEDAVDPDA